MTRRGWLLAVAASLDISRNAKAAKTLTPLDEAAFRRLVAEHKGKVLLVDFWATWCAPCRDEMPKLVALYAAEKGRGLDFVTISCDDPEQEADALKFLDMHGATMPRYVKHAKSDDDFINSIDPKWSGALPGLFLFDREGRKAGSYIGETDIKALQGDVQRILG